MNTNPLDKYKAQNLNENHGYYLLELKNLESGNIMNILFQSESFYDAENTGKKVAEEEKEYGWKYMKVTPVHDEITRLINGEMVVL